METNTLKANLDRLYNLKLRLGEMTYGRSSKGKHVMNNLIRGIEETISFLQRMDLPPKLVEARTKALAKIELAFSTIKQEYGALKPDRYRKEEISEATNKQSEIIRQALGAFDTAAC